MTRASLAALVLVLALAAFGCSGSVPPPGATLSGIVYHDANANGIRDSCDHGYPPRQIATVRLSPAGGEGESREVNTANGQWRLKEVPPGEYYLSVEEPRQRPDWRATGPRLEDGRMGYMLSVKGYESLDGLELGIFAAAYGGTRLGFLPASLVFEDSDGNGKMEGAECLLSDAAGRELEDGLWEMTTIEEGRECWTAERGNVDAAPSAAFIGVRKAVGTATIIIRVFDDRDGNGRQDEAEPLLPKPDVSLTHLGASCVFGWPQPSSGDDGEIVFSGLPDGEWSVFLRQVTCIDNCEYLSKMVPTTDDGLRMIELSGGSTEVLEFGYRQLVDLGCAPRPGGVGSASIRVKVIYSDGAFNPTENGIRITVRDGSGECLDSEGYGRFNAETEETAFEGLASGRWNVVIHPPDHAFYGDALFVLPTDGTERPVDLIEGVTATVDFNIEFVPAAFLQVQVIEDINLDGEHGTDEPQATGVYVCYALSGDASETCALTNDNGRITIGPILTAEYRIWIPDSDASGQSQPWISDEGPREVLVSRTEFARTTFLVHRPDAPGAISGCAAVSC